MALGIIDIIGLLIIIVIMVVIILCVRVLLKSYKETKNVSTLYFAMAFIFFIGAIVLLLTEKVTMSLNDTTPNLLMAMIGGWSAIIALIFSGAAIVTINIFAFHNTFPERKGILSPIIGIIAGIYVFLLCYSIFSAMHFGGALAAIVSGEMTYDATISLWSLILLMPCAISPPVVFFYFSGMTKETNAPNSKRSFWMGFAITLFFVGYVIEVLPIQHIITEYLSIPGRITLFFAAYILYICFAMPEWFKNRIGWTES